MKQESEDQIKTEEQETTSENISRKQAFKKAGYIALSAATMMLLLSKSENAYAIPTSKF